MKQIEFVFREILCRAIENKEFILTQSELSKKLGLSLSIVNLAVKKLSNIGGIEVKQRSFRVLDVKKMLYFWASVRNLRKDIIFEARVALPVREIERNMPNVVYTTYSAYKFRFRDVPADYSEVYVYADEKEIGLIKKRFKIEEERKGGSNLFILRKDDLMDNYSELPLSQIFVDLWNMKEWYAKEFVLNFENIIDKMILVGK